MIINNEQMNFFTNRYSLKENEPLDNLIFSSAMEIKDKFLYSEYNNNFNNNLYIYNDY